MSSGNEHLPLMAVGLVVNVESQIKHKVNVDKVIFFHNFHTATEKMNKKGSSLQRTSMDIHLSSYNLP